MGRRAAEALKSLGDDALAVDLDDDVRFEDETFSQSTLSSEPSFHALPSTSRLERARRSSHVRKRPALERGSGYSWGVLDGDICYAALKARDTRFDGTFFVAVTTTGIYCRPVCAAKTPRRDRCHFYRSQAEAEDAGFRACFRCRPELSPASTHDLPPLVGRALAAIQRSSEEGSGESLAKELGVSDRHLRRVLLAHLGATSVALVTARRLGLAKQLLQETELPIVQIAFASGFGSVRRLNAVFSARFGQAPSSVRRQVRLRGTSGEHVCLRLDYRPPLDVPWLFSFLGARAVAGVEEVTRDAYRRVVAIGDHTGIVEVTASEGRSSLAVSIPPSLVPSLSLLLPRLRALFDLDASPGAISERLGRDPLLAGLLARLPGVRVPGAFEPFETAVRAILGQQVSVRAATTLAGRFVARFGAEVPTGEASLRWVFPTPERIAALSTLEIASIGLPTSRAETIRSLAEALASGALPLTRGADPEAVCATLLAIRGIGPWTADYIAMRVLGSPDVLLASDLGVMKALGTRSKAEILARAHAWRPWRAYAVMLLWSQLADGG